MRCPPNHTELVLRTSTTRHAADTSTYDRQARFKMQSQKKQTVLVCNSQHSSKLLVLSVLSSCPTSKAYLGNIWRFSLAASCAMKKTTVFPSILMRHATDCVVFEVATMPGAHTCTDKKNAWLAKDLLGVIEARNSCLQELMLRSTGCQCAVRSK